MPRNIDNLLRCLLVLLRLPTAWNRLASTSDVARYTAKVLDQFADYIVHVHFDNDTLQEIGEFVNSNRAATVTLLQNYDADGYFERDDGHDYLHVVSLTDPWRFERYANVTFNLESADVVMFLVDNRTGFERDYWRMAGLDKGGCVILYDVALGNFSYVQFYCGRLHGKLRAIDHVGGDGSVPDLRRHVNDFKDFNGHIFTVGLLSNEPFAWCRNENVSDADFCMLTGVEGDLLKYMMKLLNFDVLLDFHNDVYTDYAYIIQKVHDEEVHWAIGGITLTLKRYFEADFGAPLKIESYVTMISIPKDQGIKGGYIFIPFTLTVWLCLFGNFLVISYLLMISHQIHSPTLRRNFEFFMVPLKAFLNSSEPTVRASSWSLKLLYGSTWFVLGIIFSNLYTSKLTSVLIKPHMWQPQSVKELLDNKYKFQLMPKEWAVLKESTNTTLDTVYMQMLGLTDDNSAYCDAVRKTLRGRVGFIQEETPMQFQIVSVCADELTLEEYESFRIVNERIFPNNHAWPMQLAAPYVRRFSSLFLQLQATGYLQQLYKKYDIKRRILRTNEATAGLKAIIKLDHLIDSAYILFLGYVLAVVIFFVELVAGCKSDGRRRRTRRRRRCFWQT